MNLALGMGLNKMRHGALLNYNPADDDTLTLLAQGRSGLTMPDNLGSDDISILTPTFKLSAASSDYQLTGDKTRSAEKLFDGNSYTIYFKMKQTENTSGVPFMLNFGNDSSSAKKGIGMYGIAQNMYIMFSDGTNYQEAVQMTGVDANLIPQGWVEVFIEVDFAAKLGKCKIYKADGTVLGNSVSKSLAAFTFNSNDNAAALRFNSVIHAFADFKKFLGLKTLAQCQDNSYVTDLQIYYPTIYNGTDVSGNANHLTSTTFRVADKYYSNKSTYMLDYGYSIYRKLNSPDIYIPNTPAGVAVERTITGYTLFKTVAGSLTGHNLADSYLEFTGDSSASWDKSNRTIINAFVELYQYYVPGNYRHYDAANPKRWHISELNKITMNLFYEAGYKGLTFPKITSNSHSDRNLLTEILTVSANKTGSDLSQILRYTGDNEIALNNLIFSLTSPSANYEITIKVKGILGYDTVSINWGDGKTSFLIMSGLLEEFTHVYQATGTYQIQIQNSDSIAEIELKDYPTIANASVFNSATNILKLLNQNTGVDTGILTGWSATLKEVDLWETDKAVGTAEISGDMSHMIDIEKLMLGGSNTVTGNLTDKVKLKQVYISGYSTCYGDMSNCVLMEQFETSMPITGYSLSELITVNNINGWTNLKIICTDVKINGDMSNFPIRYFSVVHDESNLTADIDTWPDCFEILSHGSEQLTGSLSSLTKLQTYVCSGENGLTKPVRFNLNPKLIHFEPNASWVWSSAEVNQLLADLWASRDDDKTNEYGWAKPTRHIKLNTSGSGAPTGQGITDLANLRAYRSPGNIGTNALWTIDVN